MKKKSKIKIKNKVSKVSKLKIKRKVSKIQNPIDLNDYEYKGRWNSADLMWTCKKCGYSADKSSSYEKETPEYISHHPDCPVKAKQNLRKNPKDHKLTKEKILELSNTPEVNSRYVVRYLNEVIEDETPSLVAYGEIADLYDDKKLDHRTFVTIKKGLDIYFNQGHGFGPRKNPRRNPIVQHNKLAFVPSNVKNWMRANVGNFEELDEYDRPTYPIRINLPEFIEGTLKYFNQSKSPPWISHMAFEIAKDYENKHKNNRDPELEFDDY